jgi:hypothetical protein
MNMGPKFRVWVTKYALTQGIFEKEAELCDSDKTGGMILCRNDPNTNVFWGGLEYYHGEGKEWHYTLESAQARAELMRTKKLASLKAAAEKIKKIDFTVTKT